MPSRLPIFPLDVVLFPGVPLPLHIFEPRYQQLLADSLAGDRRFGLTPTGQASEAPDAGAIGCVAFIESSQPLPGGRANILAQGRERIRVVEIVPDPAPYHVASVEPYDDEDGPPPDPLQMARLRKLFDAYVDAIDRLHDIERGILDLHTDPARATFQIAGAIEGTVDLKRRLIASRSAAERATMLEQALPMLLQQAEDAALVHMRARTNGTGGAHPDIIAAE